MIYSFLRHNGYLPLVNACLIAVLMISMLAIPRASYAGVAGLPQPGSMVQLSSSYVPVMMTGLTVHPENPLLMDFIVSTGNSGLNAAQVKQESDRLIKYFLACLTIPENDQWVNLSPYEKDRIIPDNLGETVLGQDMLAQDYLLKQLTASLIYPEKNLGKEFWDKVYAKTAQMYGTTEIPVNTFNKVWILPDTAKVFEHKDTVFVVKSHLKVMLDEDYLALNKNQRQPGDMFKAEQQGTCPQGPHAGHAQLLAGCQASQVNTVASGIVRQVILPAIEQEINTGRNFSQLRQIYNSMILAVWFKNNLKQALLNQVYTDKSKINGVNADDPVIKEKIYQQYLSAYKKGVFNVIKEDINPGTQQIVPRKYFSGGLTPVDAKILASATADEAMRVLGSMPGENFKITGRTQKDFAITVDNGGEIMATVDKAMAVTEIQVQRGVKYWEGISTTAIQRPFRASRQNDVKDITALTPEEALRLERIGALSLLGGEGMIAMMVAGASSRMNVKDAPEGVKAIADHTIESKAGVPIEVVDGKVITYLDAFGLNIARLENELRQQAQESGVSNKLDGNDIVLMTNEAYRAEHEKMIADQANYGLVQPVRFFNQPLEPIYWATPADVEKLRQAGKFKTEEEYQAALAKARRVEIDLAGGNNQSVVVQSQRDPLGHGEFLHQLVISGELLRMFRTGKKWFFVKNVDNYAAKFDRIWLRILGQFLDQDIDFQPEVSPRAPGQSGGSLIVMEDTGTQQLAEDPTLKATLGVDGQPKVKPTDSFWFNDAVAFGKPSYIASLYFQEGQDLEGFLAEYSEAFDRRDTAALEAIAERGRAKFPKLLDPKPAKNEPGATVKIETNMWQSTGVAQKKNIQSVGVRGARNFDINAYPGMSPEQKEKELANLRFLATKQWDVSEDSRSKAAKGLEELLGHPVSGPEVDLTLESYKGNSHVAQDLLKYILSADLVTNGLLKGGASPDAAMTISKKPELKINNGGIDLDSGHLKMERSGQKLNFIFDPAMIEQFKQGDFTGIKIQILNIVPVRLMSLLGFN